MTNCITTYTTGSRRGYIRVAQQGVGSAPIAIPADLTGIRGNLRWALGTFRRKGCTYYTIRHCQGVPGKGYSNQYCYSVYGGSRL